MTTGTSTFLADKLLNYVLNQTAYTAPTTVWIALYTVTPTAAGGGTEATGSGYARASVTCNTTNFPLAASNSIANGAAITFATATGDWSTASSQVAASLMDAVTVGNLLWWGALTASKPVLNGDTASFAVGALSILLS